MRRRIWGAEPCPLVEGGRTELGRVREAEDEEPERRMVGAGVGGLRDEEEGVVVGGGLAKRVGLRVVRVGESGRAKSAGQRDVKLISLRAPSSPMATPVFA